MGGVVKAVGKAIGFGGGSSSVQVVQQAENPKTTEDAQLAAEQSARELRMRRGRASTILTGQSGDTSNVQTATKALLGS